MFERLDDRLQNRLKMRHFSVLLMLEQHGSISRAANALGVSQPTLTKVLADIEAIFQLPLFVRTGRGVEPTSAGRVVLNRARYAVADNESMRSELEGLQQGLQGRLRIGVIPYVSSKVAAHIWRYALEYRPQISILVQEDPTPALMKALLMRQLDCAVCRFGGEPVDEGLELTLLYREAPCLVVSIGCQRMLEQADPGDLSVWRDMDWILPPATRMRDLIENMFAAQGLRMPIPRVETYSVRGISMALAQLPRGISILPLEMATQVVSSGVAVRSLQPMPTDLPPVGLAWMRDSSKQPLIQGLLATLREQGASLRVAVV